MFKGRYEHSVDQKGRTSLPSRFREAITAAGNDKVVVTFAVDPQFPHLDIHPYDRWVEFEKHLAAIPLFDPNVVLLKRVYVANAVECTIDGHGRILLPSTHRDFAGIGEQATFVGMTRLVELWNPAVWQQAQQEALSQVHAARDGLAGLAL